MTSMMDKTIDSILTALIAIVLIASAFIPVVIKQIGYLMSLADPTGGQLIVYTGLISVVVIMTIIGIIIGVIKTYQSGGSEGSR